MTLRLGPDVDPAATWADAALVTTSPSITPDYPTTEPRLRAALQALVAARAAGDPAVAGARLRVRPVPAAVPGAHDRRDRDQGQDHHLVAGPRDPRRGPAPPGDPGRQHRHAARRAPAGADARTTAWSSSCPSCSCRPSRAAPRSRSTPTSPRTTSTATARSRPTGGSSAASPSSWTPTARSCSTSRTRSWAGTPAWAPRRRSCTATTARARAGSACWTAGSWRRPWSASRSPGGGVAQAGPGGGIMPVDELGIPGRHNVVQRAGRDRGRDAVRRRPRRDPPGRGGLHGRRAPAPVGRPGRRGPVRQRLPGHAAGRGRSRRCAPSRRRSC